ncbi:cell envelope integrity protein TolA [Helicobacter sp. T3_23-1056]
MSCGGGGVNNSPLKAFFRFFIILTCACGIISLAVSDELDERLQKLERQREALQAKIQKETQIKEIKAQKKREAQEARELEQTKAKEKRAQKEALKEERKAQKEAQAIEAKIQKEIQAQTKKAQKEARKYKPNAFTDFTTSQETQANFTQNPNPIRRKYQNLPAYQYNTNPNDRNAWFIAITPNASAMAIMLNAAYPTLWNFALGEYGVAFESGYNFGKGADRWRVHFGLGYKWARSVERDERDELYDLHTITHTVGLDWTPRLGSSSVRGVLGFSKYFSYMIDKGYETRQYYTYDSPSFPYYNYNLHSESISHILWIGVSTRLGFIFDIKEHFSIEIGSKINLAVSLLGFLNQQAQGSFYTSQNRFIFGASILGSFEQYLSLAYRF